jgi:hypothetical protein
VTETLLPLGMRSMVFVEPNSARKLVFGSAKFENRKAIKKC